VAAIRDPPKSQLHHHPLHLATISLYALGSLLTLSGIGG